MEKQFVRKGDQVPSQICLNATAAAAAQSSDLPMPLMRISKTEGSIESPPDAASSHFEYAPIVKHTKIHTHQSHIAEEKQ